jgi:hypothetical protein
MKIFIEKENTLQIDENAKLILLNVDEFISIIKRESSFVPAGHIRVSLKYKLVYNNNEYAGESIFDSYKGISNTIDDNSPYKVELTNWKLSDKDEKYLEFNFIKVSNQNGFVKITRDNYKDFSWNERIKYQYRGLVIQCDHEYDAGVYMMWLDLPKGLNYKFSESGNGDLPYKHQFMAGDMFGKDCKPHFLSTITEIMDYVDKYYEYFEPHIKNNNNL